MQLWIYLVDVGWRSIWVGNSGKGRRKGRGGLQGRFWSTKSRAESTAKQS